MSTRYAQQCLDVFNSIGENNHPEFTILATSKQHNERFFLMDNGFAQKVAPGTAIDKTIFSPVYNKFYHVSAKAIKGTSQPAKYTVIYSSAKVEMEWIEEFTNSPCHFK